MNVVLVTGSSGGLGYALSKKLLEDGYFVVLHYFKNKEKVKKLQKEYQKTSYLLQRDISKEQEVIRMKKELEEKEIFIDTIINNAGIDHVSELEEKTEETFLKVYKVNTLGPIYFLKHFGKYLDKKNGRVLNISSDNAIDKYDIVTLEYDLSKISLNRVTEIFAGYYKNIKINAICFGWLDTPMNDIPDNIKKEMNFVPIEKAVDSILEILKKETTGTIEIVR